MQDDNFDNIIKSLWGTGLYRGSADITLKNKLKKLKLDVKNWWKIRSKETNHKKVEIQAFLDEWDSKAESGLLSLLDRYKRNEYLMDLNSLEQKERDSLKQKCRVKWAIEGDENTKFYHSLVKKKSRYQNINGLNINGCWTEDPGAISNLVHDHFACRFNEDVFNRPKFCSPLFMKLDLEDVGMLEAPFFHG
ncbi:hypothetical protein Tco_1382920 [Tanacetum coccineum]